MRGSGPVEEIVSFSLGGRPASAGKGSSQTGRLIVNADDWGRNRETTDKILDCVRVGSVSSASAMVFMEDSERAADIARQSKVDAGLHLNLSTPFSSQRVPGELAERQRKVSSYLLLHPMARTIFHPGLTSSFEYLVRTQVDEFQRLYGAVPSRIDGHHHLHLCANVLFSRLLPAGTIARRNFTFWPDEKSSLNRIYRRWMDAKLGKEHRLVDFLFSLVPFDPPGRLQRCLALAREYSVELETHPVNPGEYDFLMKGEFHSRLKGLVVASSFALA